MTTALVFPRATPALLREHVPPGARIVAVDAGAAVALEAGLRIDLAVGDMDSLDPAVVSRLDEMGVAVERHPSAKRDTDGALALARVSDAEIVFLGAGGGRLDHAVANLHLLVAGSRRARVRAVDEDALVWVATPERPLALERPVGATLSMLPFGGPVTGITYRGLRYGLVDARMDVGDPYGMSNVCADAAQEIRVKSGALLVIEPRAG